MILSQAIIADIVPPRRRGTVHGHPGRRLGLRVGARSHTRRLVRRHHRLAMGLLVQPAPGHPRHHLRGRVPEDACSEEGPPQARRLGMATMAIGTTAIVLVTSWGGRQYAWDSAHHPGPHRRWPWSRACCSSWWRGRRAEPIMPLHLFRDRNFNLATIAGLFSSISLHRGHRSTCPPTCRWPPA